LADVFESRTILEPAAVRLVAASRQRKAHARTLRALIAEEEEAIDDPEAFGLANARFHEQLVALAGNQTLTIVAEMLNEVVARAVTIVSQADSDGQSSVTRRRGVRSQIRLVDLIESGDDVGAESHWRTHMGVVGKVMLGQQAKTVIDLLDHQ
jgi:DNA-binding FadR family transcriptional regulator